MASPSIAALAGIVLGAGESVLFYNRPNDHGILDLALLDRLVDRVGAAGVAQCGRRDPVDVVGLVPRVRPIPRQLQRVRWVRRMPQIGFVLALLIGLLPLFVVHGAVQQQLWSPWRPLRDRCVLLADPSTRVVRPTLAGAVRVRRLGRDDDCCNCHTGRGVLPGPCGGGCHWVRRGDRCGCARIAHSGALPCGHDARGRGCNVLVAVVPFLLRRREPVGHHATRYRRQPVLRVGRMHHVLV